MEVTKVTKKVYKVLHAVDKPFLKFGAFRNTREKLGLAVEKQCFNCGHKFSDDEDTYLVMLKGTHNRLFCKQCNDKALSNLGKKYYE